jgi:hypothetical protein
MTAYWRRFTERRATLTRRTWQTRAATLEGTSGAALTPASVSGGRRAILAGVAGRRNRSCENEQQQHDSTWNLHASSTLPFKSMTFKGRRLFAPGGENPMLHGEHDTSPGLAYVSMGQMVQPVLAVFAIYPPGHTLQATAPDTSVYRPSGHAEHCKRRKVQITHHIRSIPRNAEH